MLRFVLAFSRVAKVFSLLSLDRYLSLLASLSRRFVNTGCRKHAVNQSRPVQATTWARFKQVEKKRPSTRRERRELGTRDQLRWLNWISVTSRILTQVFDGDTRTEQRVTGLPGAISCHHSCHQCVPFFLLLSHILIHFIRYSTSDCCLHMALVWLCLVKYNECAAKAFSLNGTCDCIHILLYIFYPATQATT